MESVPHRRECSGKSREIVKSSNSSSFSNDYFENAMKEERYQGDQSCLQIMSPIVAAAELGSVSHLQVRYILAPLH